MTHRVSQLDHGKWDTGKRLLRTCHIRICVHKDVRGGSSACPCRLHMKVSHQLGAQRNLEEMAGANLMTCLNLLEAKLPLVG